MSQAAPRRALIVIDVQNEYVSGKLRIEHPPVAQSLSNIARLMDAAHGAGIPVVVVQHIAPTDFPIFARGSEGAALHPVVAQRPRDHLVEKSVASALTGTDLSAWLKARQVDTLTVVGYMTHNCDDSTIRQARHEGWTVELVHDAAGSLPYANALGRATAEEIHRVFTIVAHTGFAAVASSDDWLVAVARGEALPVDNILLSNRRALAPA